MSTTTRTPPTLGARMFASDRPSSGGVSKMTTSAPLLASAAKSRSIASESSSSGGFGGNGPAGMTSKFGMATAYMYELSEKLAGNGVADRRTGDDGITQAHYTRGKMK